MEDYQQARDLARKHLKIADHMLTQTFPLVRDTKLLLAVADNLFEAVKYGMDSVLYYERLLKRIPPFHDSFVAKLNVFQLRCSRRYSLNPDYPMLIKELSEISERHKQSPVEFTRNDKFVICTDSYNIKAISAEQLRKYVGTAKLFIEDVEKMVSKHDRLFR
ncbi:hypothetical protein JXA85_07225 [Candidatus Woesearchaeota archaeon]|nr:hypothetical protein [Candidatus Woesearchaeota archaeon]